MRLAVMNGDGRIAEVALARRLEEEAAAEGALFGPQLLRHPPSSWRRLMREERRYRSYGTLKFLLERARDKFESEPTRAHEITSAVLDFVDEARGPSRIHEIGLRGLAWKEHANAVQSVGDLRDALHAAEQAIAIYDEAPSLEFDQARARLVASSIHRDMGETAEALTIARECAETFSKYGQRVYRAMARLCEGHILFVEKRFAEALAIFASLVEEAEVTGDRLTLARSLLNAAESARELGDIAGARDLYPRARAHFEALGMTTETTRVSWGHALSLADEGKPQSAVLELFKVRAAYLRFGMNTHAATAALDVVRIRFEAGKDVRGLCRELVSTFAEAGLTQSAIEALAYLREQAASGAITTKKIARVRTYFGELSRQPALLFVPPIDGEES